MGHGHGLAPGTVRPLPRERVARAGVSAAAAVGLGMAGHALAGGSPTLLGALLAALSVFVPSWLLAGRERGWSVIAVVQVAGQQVVHPLLVTASGAPEPSALPHDMMFFLHVVGALVMAVWLRLGERRAWAATRRLVARLVLWLSRLLATPPAPVPTPPRAQDGPPVPRPRPVLLRHALSRRGPPLPA